MKLLKILSLPLIFLQWLEQETSKFAWFCSSRDPQNSGFFFNIHEMAEGSDFKFDIQLGFRAHHKIASGRKWAWLCDWELPKILGLLFDIPVVAEASFRNIAEILK